MLHLKEEIRTHSILPARSADAFDEEAQQQRPPAPASPSADGLSSHDSSSHDTRYTTIDAEADAAALERTEQLFGQSNTAPTGSASPAPAPQTTQSALLRPATKSPSQTLEAVYAAGKYKAGLRLDVLSVQSFMAGIYIAMAGQLFLSLGGGILGAAFFATGLLGVVLTSGELFTGDALIFVAALLGGQVKPSSVARNWTVSWCINFVGCLAWAYILGYASDALQDLGKADYAVAVAEKKVAQTFLGTFLKGIGANFMVCVGVWQATCAEEVSGKVLALWFPITGFVAMGFDHCIANQFFIPLGMFLGANITIGSMFLKLLAATLGNIVGGGIFVGGIYWYVFDSMHHMAKMKGKIRTGLDPRRASMMLRSSIAQMNARKRSVA